MKEALSDNISLKKKFYDIVQHNIIMKMGDRMYKGKKILAIIPARSGSKGLKDRI